MKKFIPQPLEPVSQERINQAIELSKQKDIHSGLTFSNLPVPKQKKITANDLKQLIKSSYNKNPPKVIENWLLDEQLSTPEVKVYHDKYTGHSCVIHRGTEGTLKDWSNNLVYALGGEKAYKNTERFKKSKAVQDKATEKYGASNVSTIGHSQGGIPAQILGKDTKEIITLNKATRPFSNGSQTNQVDVKTDGDKVSALNPITQYFSNSKKVVVPKSYIPLIYNNPLTSHAPDTLDRLGDTVIGSGRNTTTEMIEKIRFSKKYFDIDSAKEYLNMPSLKYKITETKTNIIFKFNTKMKLNKKGFTKKEIDKVKGVFISFYKK